MFPAILAGIVPTTTLVNLTTMDRHLQNAHSNQASIEVEQQLTPTSVVSVGYQHLRGAGLIMQINQNVPACAAVRQQQQLPAESCLRQQQSVFLRRPRRCTTGFTSRSCSAP